MRSRRREHLTDSAHEWTARLIALLALPLIIAGMICVGLGMMLHPWRARQSSCWR